MDVVWDRGSATAAEVVQVLADEKRWHPRTIKTMLNRLLRKGALAHRTEGNRYVYFAKLSREACLKRASRTFLDHAFAGDALLAMVHLAKTARLTPQDIARLRKLLQEERP